MTPKAAHARLLARALAYPETREEHPWGHTVVKVREKVFVFLGDDDGGLSVSLKLPASGEGVLAMFSFAEPTGYGLGKSGWVSLRFAKGEKVALPMLLEWLDESFRAVAPKRLIKAMDAG